MSAFRGEQGAGGEIPDESNSDDDESKKDVRSGIKLVHSCWVSMSSSFHTPTITPMPNMGKETAGDG